MSAIKRGTAVVQIMPAPIQGVVAGFKVDPENGQRLTEVAYLDEDGEPTSRFFKDEEIQVAPEEEPGDDSGGDSAA